ncbi:MAG: peptidoglycan DD-metalloendopeptidase family protein [Alphaproteobacteria bacterium]|nr:peptidoglycan DD-metalloendopeptidase family protein [Alphaproteobacteria bacterium]
MFRRRIILTLSLALIGGLAQAQSARSQGTALQTYTLEDLRKAEDARDRATARLKLLETEARETSRQSSEIETDLIAAAADSLRREEEAADTERRIEALREEVATAKSRLLTNQSALEDLLAGLMNLETRRPAALAAHPTDATAAVRAAILMSDVSPRLTGRAQKLSEQIQSRTARIENLRQEQAKLARQEAGLAARREEIAALAEERRRRQVSLNAETAALKAETRRLASEAATLRDLLTALSRSAPKGPSLKPVERASPKDAPSPRAATPAASQPGKVGAKPTPPASGRLTRRFNQATDQGPSPGLIYATRSGAQIVSPMNGRIQFAGLFRSYGQMMILDVGGGVLVVISGLDALYAEAGKQVMAGEPVGRMADRASPPPELYFEVRRNGQPIDPERWLSRGS